MFNVIILTKIVKMLEFKKDSFGNTIRKLRLENGQPLRMVASYLNIDQAILSKIEHGKRKASRNQVLKLASYFNVASEEFLISWMSDNIVYEIAEEKIALKALQLAEEKLAYVKNKTLDFNDIKNKFKDYFSRNNHISKAWIFGSFARGDYDYRSDIDLMIEVPHNISFTLFDIAEIKYQLEKIVPVNIDIVMKDSIRPNIMHRIQSELKVIYER